MSYKKVTPKTSYINLKWVGGQIIRNIRLKNRMRHIEADNDRLRIQMEKIKTYGTPENEP